MVKFYKNSRKTTFFKSLLSIIAVILPVFFAIVFTEKRITPTAREISSKYTATYVNKKIDEITADIINNNSLSYKDFYTADSSFVTVNSILVNQICSQAAAELSEALNNAPEIKITLPLGAVTGTHIFSEAGPKIPVKIYPIGSAEADWRTETASLGINSINYRIFINIKITVSSVNPLGKTALTINRRYLLVDTIISRPVPSLMLTPSAGAAAESNH